MNEAQAILLICGMLGGEPESTHHYSIGEGAHWVKVDCETETEVIEIGLDTRSSLDSVQQAEFFGWLTGKQPVVILVDRDGVEGQIEFRVKTVARRFGVKYRTIAEGYLTRWQMTAFFRERRR